MVDGPYILGISIDKYEIYGFDCENDTQFKWNLRNRLRFEGVDEPP